MLTYSFDLFNYFLIEKSKIIFEIKVLKIFIKILNILSPICFNMNE